MCLGIPGRIVELDHSDAELPMGRIDFGGVVRSACVAHVPDAVVGDWVLVHVGFAWTRLSEEDAKRTFELLHELGQLELE
jgi:hydrogenase expression/formation protein HypC